MARATVHPNHRLISSEDVKGTSVFATDGTQVGDISHLLIDKVSGRVAYVLIRFGGFLGLGHSQYPVPWPALKYDVNLAGYVTGITEQQLSDAPAFGEEVWGNRSREAAVHKHYGVANYWDSTAPA
jgi:sporulation protein YlmC with PRC-barrel domain